MARHAPHHNRSDGLANVGFRMNDPAESWQIHCQIVFADRTERDARVTLAEPLREDGAHDEEVHAWATDCTEPGLTGPSC